MIINPYAFGVAYDPDAQAFFTASGLTGATNLTAINTLVVALKGYGIWTKMKAIYPFVGGTAALHKWNLKDPRDLDAAFRLVFNGGYTHNSNGITGNALNAYADTKLIPNTSLSLNDTHISIYIKTNNSGDYADMGTNDNISGLLNTLVFNLRWSDGNMYARVHNSSTTAFSNSNSQGFYVASRTNSSNYKLFKNNTSNIINSASTARSAKSVLISAWNNFGGSLFYSNRNYAFATIGDGLTDTEAANFYTAVQAYQTTLSRQV